MASGTEHYREAERLLGHAHHFTYGDGGDPVVGQALATEGLGYAVLALAAATALASTGVGEADMGEWTALICEPDFDPYEGLTNADVMDADELYGDEKALEIALDVADEERHAEENAAYQYGDEQEYEPDQDDDEDDDVPDAFGSVL